MEKRVEFITEMFLRRAFYIFLLQGSDSVFRLIDYYLPQLAHDLL